MPGGVQQRLVVSTQTRVDTVRFAMAAGRCGGGLNFTGPTLEASPGISAPAAAQGADEAVRADPRTDQFGLRLPPSETSRVRARRGGRCADLP